MSSEAYYPLIIYHLAKIALWYRSSARAIANAFNSNPSSDDPSLQRSPDVMKAEKVFAMQNEGLEKLNKMLKLTQGFRKYKLLLDLHQKRKEKIANLLSTASTLACRMKQLQPSGWKDFLQVSFCLHSKSLHYILCGLME